MAQHILHNPDTFHGIRQESVISCQKQIWNGPKSLSIAAKHQLAQMNDEELDGNWMLNDFFGTIFVINLPHAGERWEKIKNECRKIGLHSFNRFPAVDGRTDLGKEVWSKFIRNRDKLDVSSEEGKKNLDRVHMGEAGCFMSHYRLICSVMASFKNALKKLALAKSFQDNQAICLAEKEVLRYSRVLIIEDSAGFGFLDAKGKPSLKSCGRTLREALASLPDNWDMLYFLAQAKEPSFPFSDHLRKLNKSYSTVALAVNFPMYSVLIKHLQKIEDPNVQTLWPVDDEISNIHRYYNVYAIHPSLVYRQPGPSHISTKPWQKAWQGQPSL